MRVEFHPEARSDLRTASLWYDEEQPGLGSDLLTAVGRAVERLVVMPAAHPVWPSVLLDPPVRRAPLGRFPYVVAYQVFADEIIILAIAHERRRPLYWIDRA